MTLKARACVAGLRGQPRTLRTARALCARTRSRCPRAGDRPAGLQPDGERGFDVAAVGSPDRQAIAGMDHGDEVPEGGANEFLDGGDVDDRGAVGPHEPWGQESLEILQRSTDAVPLPAGVKPDVVGGTVDPIDGGLVDDDDMAVDVEDEDRSGPAPALDGSPGRARRREALVLDASEAEPRGGLWLPCHGWVRG